MAIPEINFKASYYLQSEILGSYFDFNLLSKFIKNFEKYFKKKRNKILYLIGKFTGFKWKQKRIDVWFFDSWHTSISYPLLLNVYGFNKDFVFFNLVHELVHNNVFDLVVHKNKKGYEMIELEAIVSLVTKKVLSKFFDSKKLNRLCKEAEFGGTYKYVWKRVKELENKIDFKKTNIKEWVSNKKDYTIKNEIAR